MITIIEDSRQKRNHHEHKNDYFREKGINILRSKLPCGDYALINDMSTVVDSKESIQELIMDICGKQHERFVRELELAQSNGIKLIILVENEAGWVDKKETIYNEVVRSIDDLFHWVNPRLFIFYKGKQKYPRATRGRTIAKCCLTLEKKYGVEFRFCRPSESGKQILEILGVEVPESN